MVKEGLNSTWNCGDNLTVDKLSTKASVLAWIGDINKYIPGVMLYFPFSNIDSQIRDDIMHTQVRLVVTSDLC